MRAYSAYLRERVLADCDAGTPTAEVASKYRVSPSWGRRLKQRRRETGETAPRAQRYGPTPRWAEHLDAIRASAREAPGATLEEHRRRFGLDLGISTLWRAFHALGLTYKKVLKAAEQDRPDVPEARRRWREAMPGLDSARLVFVDETWASTDMTRTRGRAPSGVRLVMALPHGHWKTTTFVAGLRTDGVIAPVVVDGAINGELFAAYVRQQLVPAHRRGDVVVMDNLACHKRAGVREAIEGAGCRLMYLPPYSPVLNPIELAFSKLKALLRKAGERTVDGLWRLLGRLVDEFPPTNSAGSSRIPDTGLHLPENGSNIMFVF
ncbi:IS630 family transposase [Paludisphaera sp. Pla2]|uniref:IS630 family transposase n=1 Tax=Paludisphaera mucosa TaxID=3030827 RepID=A0ABT6FD35_9BACT|nr:IS630 family transposase [Paludisphaera mucosa]